ncbi:MAG: helix-turn-helix domain-containing protein [Candidatus Kariarchaeaceae archaeon]|jgi:ACT domain-containing protein
MKAIAKTSRVNTALQVIQHMNDGMTVVDACKEMGMPRSTFYDVVKKNPKAITDYQEIVEANARHQLGLILFHKSEILQKVIKDGLSERTPPRERLAIYKALNELEVGLTDALRIESQAATDVHEILKQGPVTSQKVSRLTATQTSVIIEREA